MRALGAALSWCIGGIAATFSSAWASLWRKQEFGFCNGFRALAVVWVCADHGSLMVYYRLQGMGARLYNQWWAIAPMASGGVGVDVFLVLSGFLIGGALRKEMDTTGRISFGKFCVRRVFRIFPAIFAAMLLTAAGEWAAGEPASCPNARWWENLIVLNNLPSSQVTCLGQTWTVALELQLYFATPLLFAAARGLARVLPGRPFAEASLAIALCALLWLACCGFRYAFLVRRDLLARPSTDLAWIEFYLGTPFRYGAYVAGVLAGAWVARGQEHEQSVSAGMARPRTTKLFAVGALSLLLGLLVCSVSIGLDLNPLTNPRLTARLRAAAPHWAAVYVALARPLFGAALAAVFAALASGRLRRLGAALGAWPWRPLAVLSYSMYLLQFVGFRLAEGPVLAALGARLADAPLWLGAVAAYGAVFLFVLSSVPLAFLSLALVELPGVRAGKALLRLCGAAPQRAAALLPCWRARAAEVDRQATVKSAAPSPAAAAGAAGDAVGDMASEGSTASGSSAASSCASSPAAAWRECSPDAASADASDVESGCTPPGAAEP